MSDLSSGGALGVIQKLRNASMGGGGAKTLRYALVDKWQRYVTQRWEGASALRYAYNFWSFYSDP